MSLKIGAANIPETIRFIEDKMKTFSPWYPFEYMFFDEVFDNVYKSEQKIGSLISVFALIAVFVACLGLFGLASFTAEQKTKEIGIRKTLGASISHIIILMSKEFSKWVLVSNIIAWPVAYYGINRWLQSFAYKDSLRIEIFAVSALIAFIIAVVTVGYQAVKAASADPVESLRYE